jgi:hypothetical protein
LGVSTIKDFLKIAYLESKGTFCAVVPQCFILGREPHQGNLYQVIQITVAICQILGLLSVELKFETLFEIQFSATQQTNQRQQRPCQNGEQRTHTIYAKCTRDFRTKEGLMDQFTTPHVQMFHIYTSLKVKKWI